jgi:ribosomal protein L20A (L18A)
MDSDSPFRRKSRDLYKHVYQLVSSQHKVKDQVISCEESRKEDKEILLNI